MHEKLSIGVASHHGPGSGSDYAKIARSLMEQSLAKTDYIHLPIRAQLLLATADWCNPSNSLSKYIRQEFKLNLNYSIPLIGASVAGIYASTDCESFIGEGLVLITLCSEEFYMTVGSLSRPYSNTERERRQRLQEMADNLQDRARFRLSTSIRRNLLGFLPGVFLDEAGQQVYLDNDLHEEITRAFNYQYRIYGGAAADGFVPTKGYQFADDECLESGLALAILENNLNMGAAFGHGFVPVGDTYFSVDRLVDNVKNGYDVDLLDGMPARERLRSIENDQKEHSQIVLGISHGIDFDIILPLMSTYRGEGGSIRLNRRVSKGDHIYLLNATPDNMIEGGLGLFRNACRNAKCKQNIDLNLTLAFSSLGRYNIYDKANHPWHQVVKDVRHDYPGVPIVVGLFAGEFGVDSSFCSRANNMSLSICCLTNKQPEPKSTNEVQESLLTSAAIVATRKTQKEVMKTALETAVKAGAQGGQICLVDWHTKRIIGAHWGYAYKATGSNHNWHAVLELTNRDTPNKICPGDIPPTLMEWSIRMTPLTQRAFTSINIPDEDILTFIVRCCVTLFVPDARDPKFLCEQNAVNACVGPPPNTFAYLAIPLIGSSGLAIATMQVSFPDKTILDRESMRLWVGFAQKVAAALERVQEAEELSIKDAISTEASHALEKKVNTQLPWHKWCGEVCQPFIKVVRDKLQATAAHIRILNEGSNGDEFTLIAGDGDLEALRCIVRPAVPIANASSRPNVLDKNGWITNTRNETQSLNKLVGPLEGSNDYQEAFIQGLDRIESKAKFSIYSENESLLGWFVIDSNKRYFFTDRWTRIARFAAEFTTTMIRNSRIAYDRALLVEDQEQMIKALAAATRSDADKSLRDILHCLCDTTGANVGSIYKWHKNINKLILHTAHNWSCKKEMEGKASYEYSEGWTGKLGVIDNSDPVQFVEQNSESALLCTKKYYDYMVPKAHQVNKNEGDARIGIRLAIDSDLLGIVTLSYWSENRYHMVKNKDRIKKRIEALIPLVTLAIEAAEQEMIQREIAELVKAEKAAAEIVIQAARPDGDWQAVVNTIRTMFKVERVTLYSFDGRNLFHYHTSVEQNTAFVVPFRGPIEPSGPMRQVVFGATDLLIGPNDPYLFSLWPTLTNVKGCFFVPVVCTVGDVKGVLEFVNRISDREHPFEIFDSYEQAVARDVARIAGAGLDHRSHEISEGELKTQMMTAMKIGAASIVSAIVMHQVMAPCARIQQAVEWLKLNPEASYDERKPRLDRIQTSCIETVRIINQAAESGPFTTRREKLSTIIGQSIRVVTPYIPITGIELKIYNIVEAIVLVDVVSIVGSIVNILSNAIDAIGKSGVLEIYTELAADAKMAIIHIRNTGTSLTQEQIKQFFLPGYTDKPKQYHLGLGLNIAQRVIQIAGGTMQIIPCPAGGAEVIVTLPTVDKCEEIKRVVGE